MTRVTPIFSAICLTMLGSVSGATLYEYNFTGGSLLNTGEAGDGTLVAEGTTPVFLSSYTDSNGVTRNDLYDYSTGVQSNHYSNITNQTLASYTIGLWVLCENPALLDSTNSSIFMNDDIQIQNTSGAFEIRDGNHAFGTIQTDVWQLVVLTNDETNTRAYVDGVLVSTISGSLGTAFNEIGIGTNRARNNAGRWNGLIDDVFVMDTVMSEGDILNMYNTGIPEPSVLALFGLSGLLLMRRTRGAA